MAQLSFEKKYRVRGGRSLAEICSISGWGLSMWASSGVTTFFFAALGTVLILYGASQGQPGTVADLDRTAAAGIRPGRRPLLQGGLWQIITICAVGAFTSWALREVEICRKLAWAIMCPSPSALRSLPM